MGPHDKSSAPSNWNTASFPDFPLDKLNTNSDGNTTSKHGVQFAENDLADLKNQTAHDPTDDDCKFRSPAPRNTKVRAGEIVAKYLQRKEAKKHQKDAERSAQKEAKARLRQKNNIPLEPSNRP